MTRPPQNHQRAVAQAVAPDVAPDVAPAIPSAGAPAIAPAGAPVAAPHQKRDLEVAMERILTFVRSEEFLSRFQRLQLVNPETVQHLLKTAVAEAIGAVSSKLDDELEKTVLEEAEQAFRRKYADLRSSAKALESRVLKLQACLNAAESDLREPPKKPSRSENLAAYQDILLELEQRFTLSLRSNKAPAAMEESLREGMRHLLVRLFKKEFCATRDRLEAESQKKVALLEEEVRRLRAGLDRASEDRRRLSQRYLRLQKGRADALVADRAQGSDPASDLKLSLLRELVQINRDLRAQIAAARLAANGVRKVSRIRMSPAMQP